MCNTEESRCLVPRTRPADDTKHNERRASYFAMTDLGPSNVRHFVRCVRGVILLGLLSAAGSAGQLDSRIHSSQPTSKAQTQPGPKKTPRCLPRQGYRSALGKRRRGIQGGVYVRGNTLFPRIRHPYEYTIGSIFGVRRRLSAFLFFSSAINVQSRPVEMENLES